MYTPIEFWLTLGAEHGIGLGYRSFFEIPFEMWRVLYYLRLWNSYTDDQKARALNPDPDFIDFDHSVQATKEEAAHAWNSIQHRKQTR